MKHFFIHLLRTLLVLCALFYCDIVVAQPSPAQCLGNIQKRLDELGSQTDFDYLQMRDIMKKFDFGEISFAVADPNKAKAFKRVITSLSEFCDAAGNSLSAKGMKGYTRTSGVLIRSSDEAITQLNLDHLKAAFTRNGTFKGSDFSKVMEVIGDETKVSIDSVTRTIQSKATGLKYGDGPKVDGSYTQGERHSLTHILRGHVENDFSVPDGKSLFKNPDEILTLVDQAWTHPNKTAFGSNGWVVDFQRPIGTSGETKIRIHVDGDNVRSAFPIQ